MSVGGAPVQTIPPHFGEGAAQRPGGVASARLDAMLHLSSDVPRIGSYVRLVEAHYPISQRLQIRVAIGVMTLSGLRFVQVAVDLDDDLDLQASEVRDVRADRHLLAEVNARRPQHAQFEPKQDLAFGQALPQASRLLLHLVINARAGHRFVHRKKTWSTAEATPPGRCAATLPGTGRDRVAPAIAARAVTA